MLNIFLYLAAIWPAGKYNRAHSSREIGWVSAGQVCRSWRTTLHGSSIIWALWLTSFCNIDVFNVFLQKAGQAPLWVDLCLLYDNANGKRLTSDLIATVMAHELWSKAYAIVANYRQNIYNGYSAVIASCLSSVSLANLSVLDMYIPKETPICGKICAPRLTELSMRSDAEDMDDCPLSVDKLQYLFDSCQRLAIVRLRRCIDTRGLDHTSDYTGRKRTELRELHIESLDEALLTIIHAYFTVTTSSSVVIDVRSASDIANAMELSFTRFGYSLDALDSLEIQYDCELQRHRARILRGADFFSLCMRPRKAFAVIMRMGSYDNSWSWMDVASMLPCRDIKALTISNPEDKYCDHDVRPTDLLRELRGLRSVTLSDRRNIRFLDDLPPDAPISTIIASFPSGTNNEDLSDIWHCLDTRGGRRDSVTLILDGVLSTTKNVARYRHLEMPLLVALTEFAVLKDFRTYKQIR
ncbi:unnamed protein product [Peniophora sp. CBMAI 1063]|nr:unnamed protein product [Peniophora sp. CBMAI 1063]